MAPESDARMCLNHCKYWWFLKVPPFWLIDNFGVLGDGLGPHFGSFLGSWGSILVVWEGLGNRLEF